MACADLPGESPELECIEHDGIQYMFYAVKRRKISDQIANELQMNDNNGEFFFRPLISR